MTFGHEMVGMTFTPVTTSWEARDCAVYALGIGAGQDDSLAELEFTTDNTRNHPQLVYPTFAVVPGCAAGIGPLMDVMKDSADLRLLLHGEQKVEQVSPLPTAATVSTTAHIAAAWDKGTSTVIETVSQVRDATSGVLYARTTQGMFFRGFGGWGGARGPASTPRERHDRAPDDKLEAMTRPDQALLYRQSGDTNPLHTDPVAAHRAGFDKPILHGLCAYGVVGRVLMSRYAESDPTRFVSLSARLSTPTAPGDALTVLTWLGDGRIDFVVLNGREDVVINNGSLQLTTGLLP